MKASRTQHVRIPNIRDRSNNNMVERLVEEEKQKILSKNSEENKETDQTNKRTNTVSEDIYAV